MTIEQVRKAYHDRPFRPFVLHLADGRGILVRSPEFMLISPSGRTVIVSQLDDSYNVIDLLLVTDLEFRNGRRRAAASR
jgi:hypothetical protein